MADASEKKTVKKTTVKKTTQRKPVAAKTAGTETKTVKKAPVRDTAEKTTAVNTRAKKTATTKQITIDVLDTAGKVVGQVTLPGEMFAAKVNPVLMAQAVRVYLSNQRRGTVSTKTRGEVAGSTRKIYRQKGTGRARHGGIRAPIFVGGGVVFGPKQRDYSQRLPQKMRRAALFSALTSRYQDKSIKVIQGLEALEPKTKVMYSALQGMLSEKNPSVLLVMPTDVDSSVKKAVRNIAGVTFIPVNQLNTYEVLRAKQVVMMKGAADTMSSTFSKGDK